MKKMQLLFILLFSLIAISNAQTFTLKSNDVGGQATNKQVFNGFACMGENISPELYWENPPEGTKSFAVTIYDRDAPSNCIQSVTDFGKPGYGGPCPPVGHGFHTYIITVYALKVDKLGLDKNTNPALVGFNLFANTIEKASIVMYYKR